VGDVSDLSAGDLDLSAGDLGVSAGDLDLSAGDLGVSAGDLVLSAGDVRLGVSPANGGRLTGLRIGDLDVIGRGGHRMIDWGSYPMAPYAGRVRGGRLAWDGATHQLPLQQPPNAIHGVTLDRPWEVIDADQRDVDRDIDRDIDQRAVTLRCSFDSRWPWPGHAVQHLELAADGSGLLARLEVHADRDPMPAWSGFHPWFARRLARGGPATIDLAVAGMLRRDAADLPIGEVVPVPPGPWDDCFVGVRWPVTLTWPGALALAVSSDAGYAVVFDGRRDAVCVEPQTAPPNAVELGRAATVEPGASLVLTMSWDWQPA
jgi:galactose mutarotase-like enzyme